MFTIVNPIVTVGIVVMISGIMTALLNYKKRGGSAFNTFIAGAIIACIDLLFPQPASAQEPPPEPSTVFSLTCFEHVDESIVIRWGYEANGAYRWAGSGYDFTTQPGAFPLAFEYATPIENPELMTIGLGRWHETGDPAYDLIAGGLVESVFIELTFDDLPDCNEPTPEPTPNGSEPTPRPCPAWSIDSATGGLICLWELPDPPELTPEPD